MAETRERYVFCGGSKEKVGIRGRSKENVRTCGGNRGLGRKKKKKTEPRVPFCLYFGQGRGVKIGAGKWFSHNFGAGSDFRQA